MTAVPAPPPAPAPEACATCLCDIIRDGDRWRLAWGGSEDPYGCHGGQHEPRAAPAPEAATPDPVAATVAALVELAHNRNGASRIAREGISGRSQERACQLEGEAIGLDAAAALVRERLAPAWDALAARLAEAEAELAKRDKAYRERAALVAYLAAAYPSVITDAPDTGGAWKIIYVTTPAGQMSWHLSGDDLDLFLHVADVGDVPGSGAEWDGHTTEQKYERLEELTRTTALGGVPDAG